MSYLKEFNPALLPASDPFYANTHAVLNQTRELADYNLYAGDRVLMDAVKREGGAWGVDDLQRFGALTGAADYLELGVLANKHLPEFDSHDRFGARVDLVEFHPAYHKLMKTAIEEGLHASPWADPRPGSHVVRAAKYYMQTEVEVGHCCPVTATFASIPALRLQPDVAAMWEPKILARSYDPRNVTDSQKQAVTISMAMTEKQGGTDLRANTTKAYPIGKESGAEAYVLVGHKFFSSAPMCDAFLVLAHAPGGLTCFLLPRWKPNGEKNPIQIQRLKKKMGGRSNASTEIELRGALAWRVGPEGRGVPTIIEMVAMTRFDCMIGSSAGMRRAAAEALFHCKNRAAFGKTLVDQPLMQNVLADLALESEAATMMSFRMARAMDHRDQPSEDGLVRLVTAIGKYWICKRTPHHAYEAMECIGGSGVMEDSPMPRLYREAPINAIWEGPGNVQCLDVLRALNKTPGLLELFFDEVGEAAGQSRILGDYVSELKKDMHSLRSDPVAMEFSSRHLVDRMALALQASLLTRHSTGNTADAFCHSRLAAKGQHQYGTLPYGTDCQEIIQRAMPL